jgi:hypothetical protein
LHLPSTLPVNAYSPSKLSIPSRRSPGVDYLKYDNCYASQEHWIIDRYTVMREALKASGRPILYSLCSWGVAEPWLWAPEVGRILLPGTHTSQLSS